MVNKSPACGRPGSKIRRPAASPSRAPRHPLATTYEGRKNKGSFNGRPAASTFPRTLRLQSITRWPRLPSACHMASSACCPPFVFTISVPRTHLKSGSRSASKTAPLDQNLQRFVWFVSPVERSSTVRNTASLKVYQCA